MTMETDSRWSSSLQYLYHYEYQAGLCWETVASCSREDLLDQVSQKLGFQERLSTGEVDFLHAAFCQEFDSTFGIFEREDVGCFR